MIPPPAVIDMNVVVAGLITRDPGSPTAVILDGMLAGRFPFILSVDLLSEYGRVLERPRIARLHGLGRREIDVVLTEIVANAMMREPAGRSGPAGKDRHLVALIAENEDALLVTGDGMLLERESRAVTPSQYVSAHLSTRP